MQVLSPQEPPCATDTAGMLWYQEAQTCKHKHACSSQHKGREEALSSDGESPGPLTWSPAMLWGNKVIVWITRMSLRSPSGAQLPALVL